MFLTPAGSAGTVRFAITTCGAGALSAGEIATLHSNGG